MNTAHMSESASIDVIALRMPSKIMVCGIFGNESREICWVWCSSVRFSFKDKTAEYSFGFDLVHHSGPLKEKGENNWAAIANKSIQKSAYDAFNGVNLNK